MASILTKQSWVLFCFLLTVFWWVFSFLLVSEHSVSNLTWFEILQFCEFATICYKIPLVTLEMASNRFFIKKAYLIWLELENDSTENLHNLTVHIQKQQVFWNSSSPTFFSSSGLLPLAKNRGVNGLLLISKKGGKQDCN